MTKKEAIARKVKQELLSDIDEYIELWNDKACLDGWFTPEQLRRIANAIERLRENEI